MNRNRRSLSDNGLLMTKSMSDNELKLKTKNLSDNGLKLKTKRLFDNKLKLSVEVSLIVD